MTGTVPADPRRSAFESIRQEQDGAEYWLARALGPALGYEKYDNFVRVVGKARLACVQSGQIEAEHFADVGKMVDIGSGARREVADVRLSRYACYLLVQNGDPSKPVIAH